MDFSDFPDCYSVYFLNKRNSTAVCETSVKLTPVRCTITVPYNGYRSISFRSAKQLVTPAGNTGSPVHDTVNGNPFFFSFSIYIDKLLCKAPLVLVPGWPAEAGVCRVRCKQTRLESRLPARHDVYTGKNNMPYLMTRRRLKTNKTHYTIEKNNNGRG